VQKLLEKDLVIIKGRNEDAVGKPLIYATSKSFMDYFGINSADELPKINEVYLNEVVKATEINNLKQQGEEIMHEHDVTGGEMGSLHIVENEVPTHIHAEELMDENIELTESDNIDEATEIKQDKQKETDTEEAS